MACQNDDTFPASYGALSATKGESGMRRTLLLVAFCAVAPGALGAASLDKAMKMLSPEERAHQACILKGLDQVRRDKKLPNADRMKTGIFKPATFDGTTVAAKGGAIRAKTHWYELSFTCAVTADQMKAETFSYQIGAEIPEDTWDDLGLWR